MDKQRSTIQTIVSDIENFYEEQKYHFLSLNGVMIDDESIEVQWMFSQYGKSNSLTMFYVEAKISDTIPSVTHILPSAIISQRELVDMFGVEVEDTTKGLYLDEDSQQMPLKSCGV